LTQETVRGKIIEDTPYTEGQAMNIWLPHVLYQAFPLLCVIVGFLIVMLCCNPAGIVIALGLYLYSFSTLWMRAHPENSEEG
jgi:hypothetical protein